MRKLIMFNLMTLDGFFAGVDDNIDWHNVDDEFNDFAVEQTASFGAIVFGRKTYDLFYEFWPSAAKDPKMSPEDKKIGQIIDTIDKIVYSTSMKKANWRNTTLYHTLDPEEVKKLKEQKGKDMVIFGSGQVVQQMAKLGLIDEYRVLVNPIVLGEGKPLFKDNHLELKLINSREFSNGNILLTYKPA